MADKNTRTIIIAIPVEVPVDLDASDACGYLNHAIEIAWADASDTVDDPDLFSKEAADFLSVEFGQPTVVYDPDLQGTKRC